MDPNEVSHAPPASCLILCNAMSRTDSLQTRAWHNNVNGPPGAAPNSRVGEGDIERGGGGGGGATEASREEGKLKEWQ